MCVNVTGQSIDPSLAGILGRRAPRSKQPFMVTFFRASKNQIRSTRAIKQLKKRQQKKHSDLPHPNKLPGVFGKTGMEEIILCLIFSLYLKLT